LRTARHKRCVRPTGAIAIAASALLVCACGGSSGTRVTTFTAARLHGDVVSNGTVTHTPIAGSGGSASNDDNPSRADSGGRAASGESNPCELVSKAEAQRMLGAPIAAPQEAPLGPTCIYQPAGAHNAVTVVIETTDFAKLRSQMRNRRRMTIAGRVAYCGDLGRPNTLVALKLGRVLSITAPCTIGLRFAAAALPRIPG
jgi:hypothetical protein